MSRYVRAFASLSWQSGQSTAALNIESLENHLQFPIGPFDVQLHKCLQNEEWKHRYLRTWDFQNYHHINPQAISSPFTLKSQSVFLVPRIFNPKKPSEIYLPFGPGLRRWCCGCSNVPYPTLAMTNCSPRNLRSSQWRNWRSSLLPAARNDPSSCWSYWKRRQTWRNSCVGKKRERRTPSRIEIDGIRFQI